MTPAQIKKIAFFELFLKEYFGCSFEDFREAFFRVARESSSPEHAISKACEEMEKKRRSHLERDDPEELRQYDQVEPDPTRDPEDKFDF